MLTTQDIKTAVSRYWSGRAAGFDLQPSHAALNEAQHQAWLDLLREVAGPLPLAVLDVGCGTGFLAMRMAELGHTAVGIDLAGARRIARDPDSTPLRLRHNPCAATFPPWQPRLFVIQRYKAVAEQFASYAVRWRDTPCASSLLSFWQ